MESLVCGKGIPKTPKTRVRKSTDRTTADSKTDASFDALKLVTNAVKRCREVRESRGGPGGNSPDAETLSKFARFTDTAALEPFAPFLHFLPRLVNVVTLAEAIPVPGTGQTLPLDLNFIASRCTGAYFAPKRFSAVQLAYSHPRARVLVFHTGRLVGTGTSGAMAARLAIARAQRQLSMEAGVHLQTRNFAVINQVGAVSLSATLACDQFANAHQQDSHYDAASFVGLAWRPANEVICCANLPGSVRERQLHESWSRMLPELLRFSSRSRLLDLIPEELKAPHRTHKTVATGTSTTATTSNLMDGWVTSADVPGESHEDAPGDDVFDSPLDDDFDDGALAALGL